MVDVTTRAGKGTPISATEHDDNLEYIISHFQGSTAPASPFASQLWADTATSTLKIRNTANTAWITLGTLDDDAVFAPNKLDLTGGTISGDLSVTGDLTVDTNTLYVDSANNAVGIGTSSPSEELHLAASLPTIRLEDTDNNYYSHVYSQNGDLILSSDHGNANAGSALRFEVDATERMRIDSSGNVGIGTSSLTGGNTILDLHKSGNGVGTQIRYANDHSSGYYVGLAGNTAGEGIIWNEANAGMLFGTNNTERMRIDSSGNVGIGTSSPSARLDVTGATSSLQARFGGTAGRGLEISTATTFSTPDAVAILNAKDSTYGTMVFQTKSTERMRIDSSGNVLVGTTTTSGKLTSLSSSGGTPAVYCQNSTTSGNVGLLSFGSGSPIAYRGEVFYDNSAAVLKFTGQASGTYSDARLKAITGDCKYGLSEINQLSTKTFTWVRNGKEDIGLVAQELHSVIPEAVEVGTDGELDPTGEFDPRDVWKVDLSKLVPVLVKAIQEQQAIIKELKADVAALKGSLI